MNIQQSLSLLTTQDWVLLGFAGIIILAIIASMILALIFDRQEQKDQEIRLARHKDIEDSLS